MVSACCCLALTTISYTQLIPGNSSTPTVSHRVDHDVALMCHFIVAAAIVLIKAAQQWQQQHNDKLPSTSAQRTEFKHIIKSWQRQIEGIPLEVCSSSLFTHIKSCLVARTVVTANMSDGCHRQL